MEPIAARERIVLLDVLRGFAIFPLMVIASSWWITRFRFGPAGWLWRTLTYGQIQSFRRAPKPVA